jgi:transposase, IS30 family
MKFKQLTIEEREIIQEMWWKKESVREIARRLSRSPSSISRELKKNFPLKKRYTPRLAHERALKNRTRRGRTLRLKNQFIRRQTIDWLKEGYSPEQISGRLKLEYSESISHEAIYQYIYSQVHREGYGYMKHGYHDLRQYLKRRHKRRQKKGMRKSEKVPKFNGISIEKRPKEVEKRKTIGHWEGDSIVSRKSTIGLNTLVERKTGLVFISKIKNGTAQETSKAVIKRFESIPSPHRRTLTIDNGSENADWETIEESLHMKTYFAHAYCSGERGTNENTNGLIRWYFPKGTDFATISDDDIIRVENALNGRPRKRLGWKTPLEAFKAGVAIEG